MQVRGLRGLIAFDVARHLVLDVTGLNTIVAVLVLPYALLRWGSGREAVLGLGVIVIWLAITLAVTRLDEPVGPAEIVASYGFFLFAAALGTAIRYHATARVRDVEQAKLRQRNQLARELHDTVGHHVSAIAIAAQAGRIAAPSHPERALAALETIEDAASRTLEEMRTMVRVLRDGASPDLAPQPGVADIALLARDSGQRPRIDLHLPGDLDPLSSSVEVALYCIAREALTNAVRHAQHATRVEIRVTDQGHQIRLSVRDDGDAGAAGHRQPGYGLLGMSERASILGGHLRAGPTPEGGWAVDAVLPKQGAVT